LILVDMAMSNGKRPVEAGAYRAAIWSDHGAKRPTVVAGSRACPEIAPAGGGLMATEADVRAIALSLPGTSEEQWYQTPGYKVAGKGFLRFRTEAEGGLVVFVSDLGEKKALLTSKPDAFFTTPHYDGWPIVLVNLDIVDHDELRELITDSWLIKAPPRLRRQLESQ
jgi:hypothetical protein